MLNAGQLDEATRYNMTAIIGLPAEAVEEMAHAPWWPGLVSVAPTLVYDHKASHDIETDPNWRSRWAAVAVPTVVYSGDQTFPGQYPSVDGQPAPVKGLHLVGDRDMGVQIRIAGTAVPVGERGRHQAPHLHLPDPISPAPGEERMSLDEPQSVRDGGPVGPFDRRRRGLVSDRPQH